MSAISYIWLERSIIAYNGPQSKLARAVGNDMKGTLSLMFYCVAIPLAYVRPWIAIALYAVNAALWFIPDRRIEAAM